MNSFRVGQFGANEIDSSICSCFIQFYLLPGFAYHEDCVAALCGCCREGIFHFHSLVKAFARALVVQEIGFDQIVSEMNTCSIAAAMNGLRLLTVLIRDSSLVCVTSPSIKLSSAVYLQGSQNRLFLEAWSEFIFTKITRCLHLTLN